MLQPDYKEFSRLAKDATLIPVVKSVTADLMTPVSAFLSVAADEPYSCLLESVEKGEQIGRYTFVGARPYMRLWALGEEIHIERGKRHPRSKGNVFETLKKLLREHHPAHISGLPPFTGGAVGYFAYDAVRRLENIGTSAKQDVAVPDCMLMFFDRLLAFDHLRHQIHIIVNANVSTDSPPRAYNRALKDIARIEKQLATGLRPSQWQKGKPKKDKLKVHTGIGRERYMRAVERSKEYIAAGDIFQVVMSQRVDFQPDVAPFNLYRALRTVNPSPYMYFLRMGDTHVLGSSPEMLVRVNGSKLEYRPIAGTRPRGKDEAADRELENEMRHDEKECAEHVMHLVTALEAKLRPDLDAVDAFAACFPAGTLSGAPKVRAMQIIEELEPTRRGAYGGAVLYADFAGNLDSCITIRTMFMKGKRAYLQAGAGIVADSDPAKEFQESENKARAVIRAVELARNGNL